jgi:ABC-type polysaccharide/polyol phosphate transport system ATPase subunit
MRLAFMVMVQSDPDIMLIDEVVAVGDAASTFQLPILEAPGVSSDRR